MVSRHLGGCTETFDARKAGHLQSLLDQHGVAVDVPPDLEPYSPLRTWLHTR